ncbi:hypothetical protein BN2475_40088 [Paraburkholderia ribeironis]|uniref:Uncharacterized protein n=1 Tax=Paraburkholderia ribeironis TaxID=1247936 RepID=A0A1N7RJJ1_9BURK|nr:hypothetical protein [Paraburkholderia ribeironis]SIT35273.1 hypothetical protein BN2475_40088 [Paraburkholderia ribeironis]
MIAADADEISFFYDAPAAIVLIHDGEPMYFFANRAVLTPDGHMIPTAADGTRAMRPHVVVDTSGVLETMFIGEWTAEEEARLRVAVSALENFLALKPEGNA